MPEAQFPSAGRVIVLSAVFLILVLGATVYLRDINASTLATGFAFCGILISEFFWGNKWVRWLVAALFFGWALQGLLWFRSYTPFGHLLHVAEGVIGVLLIVHPQVGRYLTFRREAVARKFRRLRIASPIIFISAAILAIFLDILTLLDKAD